MLALPYHSYLHAFTLLYVLPCSYADFKVECMTLQTFLELKGVDIKDVGLIKMDTEGEIFRRTYRTASTF